MTTPERTDPRAERRSWPAVSVTMLVHRSSGTSAAALRSVLEDGYPGRLEVLVREQGGDDDEHAALVAAAGDHPGVVVERGPNLDFCAGHERLVARATGDVLVLLNDDAALRPGFLAAAVTALDDPEVGAVQGLILAAHGSGRIDTTGIELHRSRRVAARLRGRPAVEAGDVPVDVWGVDGAVLVLRRAAADDARAATGHLLAPEFVSHMEDVELAWRLRRLGWRCRFAPDAVAIHARGTDERHRGVLERAASRRRRSRSAHVRGFANLRLTQLRHDGARALVRDVAHWLPRELAAWVALVALTPGALVPVVRHLASGIGPSWRARRALARSARNRSLRAGDPTVGASPPGSGPFNT